MFLGAGIKAEAAAPPEVKGFRQTSASKSSVSLKWDALTENDIEYKVQLCSDNRFVSGVKEKIERYNPDSWFSELSSGKTYYVRVAAYYEKDEDNPGPWTAPLAVVTVPQENKNANLCQTHQERQAFH